MSDIRNKWPQHTWISHNTQNYFETYRRSQPDWHPSRFIINQNYCSTRQRVLLSVLNLKQWHGILVMHGDKWRYFRISKCKYHGHFGPAIFDLSINWICHGFLLHLFVISMVNRYDGLASLAIVTCQVRLHLVIDGDTFCSRLNSIIVFLLLDFVRIIIIQKKIFEFARNWPLSIWTETNSTFTTNQYQQDKKLQRMREKQPSSAHQRTKAHFSKYKVSSTNSIIAALSIFPIKLFSCKFIAIVLCARIAEDKDEKRHMKL